MRHPKKERYPDISDTLKRGSKEMWHSRKHKKTATARDNDGIRCEATAVRGSFSSVGAKYIKCNNIIIHIKTPTVERLTVWVDLLDQSETVSPFGSTKEVMYLHPAASATFFNSAGVNPSLFIFWLKA